MSTVAFGHHGLASPSLARFTSPSPAARRLCVGVAGLGGYAGVIVDRLLDESRASHGRIKLLSVCDPEPLLHGERLARLRPERVELADSFDAILCDPRVDAVWLPIPIHLHRPFTERALAAGKHVICEKPAAGIVEDVDAMIRARDDSGRECLIGFQDVYQPAIDALKQKVVAGELGRPLYASVIGCWPRSRRYFERNRWAGRLRCGETWVLDSPASNAMAHFIHVALFVLGPTVTESAEVTSIEAELYRANAIENYDTCSIRAVLRGGVDLTIGMTHACAETIDPLVEIVTDLARVRILLNGGVEYLMHGATDATFDPFEPSEAWPVTAAICRRIVDGDIAAPAGTLEMARSHTALINLVSESSAIHEAPRVIVPSAEGDLAAIPGIENALRRCVAERRTLHATGALDWTRPASHRAVDGRYEMFAGVFGGATTTRR